MTRQRIIAEKIKAYELNPGDLFSTKGPEYWNSALDKGSIGERVYIRTHTSSNTADDADADIYRIKVCDAEQ